MKSTISIASILRNGDITVIRPQFFIKSKHLKFSQNFTPFGERIMIFRYEIHLKSFNFKGKIYHLWDLF